MTGSSVSIEPYLEDSSGYRGHADRVFVPGDLNELRDIVRGSYAGRIPLTIAGAGTGLTGARVPKGGWVVSLTRFSKLEIRRGVASCGPGVILSDLQQAAAQTKQFFGPNPTEFSASVGGIISTNAGGARSFHYGSVRRHVLSLDVLFMNGETRHFSRGDRVDFSFTPVMPPPTTKNSAGYYLQPNLQWVDLLAGSEGTLCIVTNAELKLLDEPAALLSGVVFFPDDESAMNAVDAWRPIPELRLLEFMDEHALRMLRSRYPEIPANAQAALLIEQNLKSENDEEVDEWVKRLSDQGAFEEQSWFGFRAADRERFRAFRHTLALMVVDISRRNGFSKAGTDYAVPLASNRELYERYKQRCEAVFPGEYSIYGHVGDANNHLNLLPATKEEVDLAESLICEFAEFVVSLHGTVAAEHGIGKSKTHLFKLMYTPEEIEAMRQVKRRLDPEWLLGQGTIFGV